MTKKMGEVDQREIKLGFRGRDLRNISLKKRVIKPYNRNFTLDLTGDPLKK